jgi:hypothetical protein
VEVLAIDNGIPSVVGDEVIVLPTRHRFLVPPLEVKPKACCSQEKEDAHEGSELTKSLESRYSHCLLREAEDRYWS